VFDADVDASSIVMYYADDSDSRIRLEYGLSDTITSFGNYSARTINGISVGGVDIPLVQRSDLENGTFYDTYWDDVFETGSGNDTIYTKGSGSDVYRFDVGDGQDLIQLDSDPYNPLMGEIRFSSSVELDELSFTFSGSDAVISYGSGDQITLDRYWTGNALTRFTLASELNPYWVPVIRGEAAGQDIFGTYGTDHILGGTGASFIRPGYGNDLIEGGDSTEFIILNDQYLTGEAGAGSIGSKQIRGAGDSDFISTPLYQGLTFYFDRGDGQDTIDYDWSYSGQHPYQFNVDDQGNSVEFEAYGEDALVFGAGISLADLRFIRVGDDLRILLSNSSDSIHIAEFFHAWDEPGSPTAGSDLFEMFIDGLMPASVSSLLNPMILALLPDTPISHMRFSNGDVVDMSSVLNTSLELSDATLIGTEGDDELYGTQGDDVIHAYDGDDDIEDPDGFNIIDAGSGNDEIRVESYSEIDAGSGNDTVYAASGGEINAGSGDDEIRTGGPSVIHAGSGDDEIYFEGGSVVYADSGDNTINVWGDNTINLGSGFDLVWLNDGNNVVRFGPGDGFDQVVYSVDAGANLIVEMEEGLTLDDIVVYKELYEGSDLLIISLPATGDELYPGGYIFDQETNYWVPHAHAMLSEIRFSNGTILSGEDLFAMAVPYPEYFFGTEGNDVITGTEGNDAIIGGAGNDVLRGLAGDDIFEIEGHGEGIDHIIGGGGFDTIYGSAGDDTIRLVQLRNGDSIERIDGRNGHNIIAGTSENNTFIFTNIELVGIARIEGGEGDDTIWGSQGDDVIVGGAGNDDLAGQAGNDTFLVEGLGQGTDKFKGGDGFDTIQGGIGDDEFRTSLLRPGSESIEKIDGGLGFNVILGTSNNDNLNLSTIQLQNIALIDAANGDDIVLGSQGHDMIVGGAGNDTLQGQGGDDIFLVVGADHGTDRIIGGSGFDTIMGSDGDDTFTFSVFLRVNDSIEKIDGGLGQNTIAGSQDNNTLDFKATELVNIALINGGEGDDQIFGSQGNDGIIGGLGNDTISGQRGDDVYAFWLGQGQDAINNDDPDLTATDNIWLAGLHHEELWFSRSGNNLLIDVVGTDDQVKFNGWYAQEEDQIDGFYTNTHIMLRNQVDQLVSAMASFDVPVGVGAVIPEETRMQLESTLTAVWQAA
jgi:Ca2+-binding RTX toxin-like protein